MSDLVLDGRAYDLDMSEVVAPQLASEAEYLALEPAGDTRYELLDGVIVAMTGASKRHNQVSLSLAFALRALAAPTSCRVSMEGVRLRAGATRHYYPDVMVACESTEDTYAEDAPCLLAEVLSPSTRWVDERHKRIAYLTLPSLRHYLLIDLEQQIVEHHHRADGNAEWSLQLVRPGDRIELSYPAGVVTVDEILAG